MNRNPEWESFVNEFSQDLPHRLEYTAHNAILRAAKRRHAALLLPIPLAGLLAVLVLLLAAAGRPARFAEIISRIPLLRRFARLEAAR